MKWDEDDDEEKQQNLCNYDSAIDRNGISRRVKVMIIWI